MADEHLVEQEAEQFDCSACPLTAHASMLDEENREAWQLFRACCNRFTQDLQAGAVVLDRLTQHLGPEEFEECTERLRIIYDVVQPRKEPSR